MDLEVSEADHGRRYAQDDRAREADVCCGLAAMRHAASREDPVAANWKLYVDNDLEGAHLAAVHPRLNRELHFGACVTEAGGRFSYRRKPVAAD